MSRFVLGVGIVPFTAEEEAAVLANELPNLKAAKLQEMTAKADALLGGILNTYPRSEVASWDKQEQEARSYLADNTTTVPMISAMATQRGVTVLEQATRIVTKADEYTTQSATIFGIRQKLEDTIDAAADVETVEAISWPE